MRLWNMGWVMGLCAVMLAGCAAREVGTVRPATLGEAPVHASAKGCQTGKVVWITIDGTSNTPVSRTAATRLHELVEAYSYAPEGRHALAVWYAEGVGSGDLDIAGKALGSGVDDDIRKAYAFLTTVWRPGDCLFLNGFSRGAYSVRALGGLLYLAGIPDLGVLDPKVRTAIISRVFKAYASSGPLAVRASRIASVLARFGADGPDRAGGFSERNTKVLVEAMTIWDSVQALGIPDRIESPTEGPGRYLLTACNVRAIFQPLSLDDNRAYSFTPILAGGPQATRVCRDRGPGRQDVNLVIDEVWFSGAHADVGGTYTTSDAQLDGELASISLNWVLGKLQHPVACPGCGQMLALPEGLRVPEDRLSAVHDGKRTTIAYAGLYRQTRKPRVYWAHTYGHEAKIRVHASALERLEWLFALDRNWPSCSPENGSRRRSANRTGSPILCAREIASYGLVPELLKENCLEETTWGYRLKPGQGCVAPVGQASSEPTPPLPPCTQPPQAMFQGRVYWGKLEDAAEKTVVRTVPKDIPYPRCVTAQIR